MNLIDALLGEHGLARALLDKVEETDWGEKPLEESRTTVKLLGMMILIHSCVEDDLLLAELEKGFGDTDPIPVMRHEHEEINRTLQKVKDLDDPNEIQSSLKSLLELVRNHFLKEEEILFPLARQVLGSETLDRLGLRWREERRLGTFGSPGGGRPVCPPRK